MALPRLFRPFGLRRTHGTQRIQTAMFRIAPDQRQGSHLVFDQEQSETLQFECAEFHAYAEDQRA